MVLRLEMNRFFISVVTLFLLLSCASKVTIRVKRCYYKGSLKQPRSYTFDETHQFFSIGVMDNNVMNDLFSYKLENGFDCKDFSILNLKIERKLSDLPFMLIPFVDSVHIRYQGKLRTD